MRGSRWGRLSNTSDQGHWNPYCGSSRLGRWGVQHQNPLPPSILCLVPRTGSPRRVENDREGTVVRLDPSESRTSGHVSTTSPPVRLELRRPPDRHPITSHTVTKRRADHRDPSRRNSNPGTRSNPVPSRILCPGRPMSLLPHPCLYVARPDTALLPPETEDSSPPGGLVTRGVYRPSPRDKVRERLRESDAVRTRPTSPDDLDARPDSLSRAPTVQWTRDVLPKTCVPERVSHPH